MLIVSCDLSLITPHIYSWQNVTLQSLPDWSPVVRITNFDVVANSYLCSVVDQLVLSRFLKYWETKILNCDFWICSSFYFKGEKINVKQNRRNVNIKDLIRWFLVSDYIRVSYQRSERTLSFPCKLSQIAAEQNISSEFSCKQVY